MAKGKAAPKIRSCADFPENGDKLILDLKTALKKAGMRNIRNFTVYVRYGLTCFSTRFDRAHSGLMCRPTASGYFRITFIDSL